MTSSVAPNAPIPPGVTLYQRATTNPIGVTAAASTNIGYLATNKTQLEVVGEITGQDPTDMYNFTFQNSGAVKLDLNVLQGDTLPRIQLLDPSGTGVIADSAGNATQQAAYQKLISSDGLNLNSGKYVVSISYAPGASKSNPNDYTVQLDSGTTYTSDYRTLAASTTIQNTLLSGGSLGYNPLTSTASMLTNVSNGTSIDIFGTLSLFSTNIFA